MCFEYDAIYLMYFLERLVYPHALNKTVDEIPKGKEGDVGDLFTTSFN